MIPWLHHHITTIIITIIQTHNTPLLAHFLHPLLWIQSTTAFKPRLWACSNTLYTSYIGSWDLLYTYVCSTIGAGIWVSIVLLNSGLALCFTDDNRPNTSGLSVSKNHQETRTIYFEKLFVSSQGTWVNTPLLRYLMVKVKMNLVSA